MSKFERYKKKGDAFDTLEIEFDVSPVNGSNVIKTMLVFDNKTGEKRLKLYYNEGFMYKAEAFATGHDIQTDYEGPTVIYEYTRELGHIKCVFKYLRSETKLYMEGILIFNPNPESNEHQLINSIHYLEDGVSIANRIDFLEASNKYILVERETIDGVSRLVFEGEFNRNNLPSGIWKIHAKAIDDHRDLLVKINTTTKEIIESELM